LEAIPSRPVLNAVSVTSPRICHPVPYGLSMKNDRAPDARMRSRNDLGLSLHVASVNAASVVSVPPTVLMR
jgi:hypothetical protein